MVAMEICLLVSLLAGAPQDPPKVAQKAPPPSAEDQKRLAKGVRELYKADYANPAPADQRALALKLMDDAAATDAQTPTKYVLLTEARDVAAKLGAPVLTLEAVDEMGRHYAIDLAAAREDALEAVGKAAKTQDSFTRLAEAWLQMADEAAAAGDYAAALKFVPKADSAARSAKSAALTAQVKDRGTELREERDEQNRVLAWREKLAADPDDAEANLGVGMHECLALGRWEDGLPRLAKGSEADVAEAARQELAAGAAPVSIADAWWAAGEKKKARTREGLLQRAFHWYGKALEGLKGAERAELQKRVDGLAEKAYGGDFPRRGLVFWVEPGRDPADPYRELVSGAKATNHGAKVDPTTKALSFNQAWIDYAAPPAVRQIENQGSVFAWIKADAFPSGGLTNRGEGNKDDFAFMVFRGKGGIFTNWPENTYPEKLYLTKSPLPLKRWTHLGAVWNERSVGLFLDGKPDGEYPLTTKAPIRRSGVVSVGSNPPGGHEYFGGMIGSVAIYNRALSAAEVGQLHTTGKGRFR